MPQTKPKTQAQSDVTGQSSAGARSFSGGDALRAWHLVSLDAPTVAVVWSLAFAWAAHVSLPAWVPVLLALATWAVYIADRLLDARSALRTGGCHRLRERHRFHWRYRRILFPVALGAACAAACIVLMLTPHVALEGNSVLAAAALVYFTGVHSARRFSPFGLSRLSTVLSSLFTKELLVGFLFTAGCVLPVFSRAVKVHLLPLGGLALYFAMLAWLNCFAINCWESRKERSHGPKVFSFACLVAVAGAVLAFGLGGNQPRPAALVVAGACSAMLLALLDILRSRLSPLGLRAAADLVLLTPMVLLLR